MVQTLPSIDSIHLEEKVNAVSVNDSGDKVLIGDCNGTVFIYSLDQNGQHLEKSLRLNSPIMSVIWHKEKFLVVDEVLEDRHHRRRLPTAGTMDHKEALARAVGGNKILDDHLMQELFVFAILSLFALADVRTNFFQKILFAFVVETRLTLLSLEPVTLPKPYSLVLLIRWS